jgi:hypothetical protein
MRIGQFRQLPEHFGHLVAALAASDEHNHVRLSPAAQLVLQDRFARAEPARHSRCTSLGQRKKRVEHALAGQKRHIGGMAFPDWSRLPDAPSLGQPDFGGRLCWSRWCDAGDDIPHPIRTGGGNPGELAAASRRRENAMDDPRRLLHGADCLARVDDGASGDARCERPQAIGVQRPHPLSASEEIAFRSRKPVEGPLNAVEDRAEQSGTEIDSEGAA